ncbi:MAG TPA: hypothetical protein VHB21_03035, partial [Minicystis sp.]|nr:hypothetical protein [Minicystis sp.]
MPSPPSAHDRFADSARHAAVALAAFVLATGALAPLRVDPLAAWLTVPAPPAVARAVELATAASLAAWGAGRLDGRVRL